MVVTVIPWIVMVRIPPGAIPRIPPIPAVPSVVSVIPVPRIVHADTPRVRTVESGEVIPIVVGAIIVVVIVALIISVRRHFHGIPVDGFNCDYLFSRIVFTFDNHQLGIATGEPDKEQKCSKDSG
jgi:hypothetical protein